MAASNSLWMTLIVYWILALCVGPFSRDDTTLFGHVPVLV